MVGCVAITFFWPALLFFPLPALAQLIPAGQPVPRTAKPPVIFVNGYQNALRQRIDIREHVRHRRPGAADEWRGIRFLR